MAVVIAVANQKGGVGKTTIATNLAATLSLRGHRTLLVDADPQGTSTMWRSVANGSPGAPTVVSIPNRSLADPSQVPQLAAGADFLLIDCPPALGEITKAALMVSDLALVPVHPSAFDVWSVAGMARMLADATTLRRKLRAAFVVSRRAPRSRFGDQAREALRQFGHHVCATEVYQRADYAAAGLAGSTVTEYAADDKAAAEINALADEVIELCRSPEPRSP